ncbi:hypothetical protein LMG26857_03447 [Achromobacter anxifer]|uniref:hypothetical protein n=1 Tax=Achromobacter anxifer TaxID=1287737 RepID=UPI00155CF683|nr:hypothetical protein [Achromobacter anxifer]CAB5514388.1 hypothetical protein LMG26857_03447 [Achromobacter anxifer]
MRTIITRQWLLRNTPGAIPLTADNLAVAKAVLTAGWKDRARERELPEPEDLSGACKFASLLVKLAFGGRVQGCHAHQYNVVDQKIIDLTEQHEFDGLGHDEVFFGNPEHLESLTSCLPRVHDWLQELTSTVTTAA